MVEDRQAAVAAAIGKVARLDDVPIALDHVCRACAQMLDVDGVSLCTISDLGLGEPIAATNALSDHAVELEITIGVGPGMEALDEGETVLAHDLTSVSSSARWPALAAMLVGLGVQAVFALPLTTSDVTVGVLELYRRRPKPLTEAELADAQLFADYALHLLVIGDRDPSGWGIDALLTGSLSAQWARVHQAIGVVSAQLEIGASQAYQRLRAHTFASDLGLREVAGAVLDGRVRFTA
ncbi:GAF and ANTAR domain-containing protein [Kutzneria chonburiensis]|uniref:GAF and ANTAR domain-containing protein n=1 Tax=Kutzneria chonburiensis TaxID=1483604 RepID=A0ABV6MQP1_9PSEU|nr:GAF and ANTAR domain-containing protein [Kutzneria chonburiensis]